MKKPIRPMLAALLVICMISNLFVPVQAANRKFKYIWNGKTYTYNGRTLKLTAAGEKIDLSDTPPVFRNDTSMFPYEEAFENADLNVRVSYDSDNKTITFSYYDKKVAVTVDQKKAMVNDTSWSLPVAPMEIRYKSSGETRILVPAEAIALKLGLNYVYTKVDSTTGAIVISEKAGIKIQYNGVKYNHTGSKAVIYTKKKKISTAIPGLMIMNNVMVPAAATYGKGSLDSRYSFQSSTGVITIKNDEHTVTMTIGSTTAYVDGEEEELDCTPLKVKLLSNKKFYVMVPSNFVSTALDYSYNYSSSQGKVIIGLEDAIAFPLPSGISQDEIELSDGPGRQVQITVPGSHAALYQEVDFDGLEAVTSSQVTAQGSDTVITLNTSTYQAARLKEKSDVLKLTMVKPKEVYDRIVVIDAGHGGSDPGAVGNGLREKDLTLKILKYCKSYFDQDESIKVYYSRTTDVFVNLYDIRNIPDETEADMFVSIHIDAYDDPTPTGTSVLYNGTLNQKNDGGLSSYVLAARMIDKVQKATGLVKRYGNGLSNRPNLVVLKAKCPAVLIETGFITNPDDVAKVLGSNAKLKKVGKAIYDTVAAAFEDYPR